MPQAKRKQREDLNNDKSLAQAMRLRAEEAKKHLSQNDRYSSVVYGTTYTLEKSAFEELIMPLIEKTMNSCRSALKDAGLQPPEIDSIVMVGGSTRVPLVKETVGRFFGKPVNDSVNPDEVVALGAASGL